jgi:hypothetical protein
MLAPVVIMSHAHTQDEVRLSQERRDGIINYLLEWLTGDQVDSKTLGHFRFIGEMFSITPKVREMCRASSPQGRQELALSIALAALNMAVSDEPVQPTERQIERWEYREAAKQFEPSLARKSDADGGACVGEPDKVVKLPSIHNRPRAELSPDDLERVRKSQRERQARWRAKAKSEKAG